MKFSVDFGVWNAVFAVPSQVVDKHLKLAGGVHLKVLLWLLRHSGDDCTPEAMSQALGIAPADIKDAMQYWVAAGILTNSTPPLHTAQNTEPPTPAEPEKPPLPPEKPLRIKRPDGLCIAERITECPEIGFLMQEAQQILGRTLSPALSSVLLMAHDDYGLPVEVIIMLLMYVKSIHKDNTSYIQAVARSWAQEEINTHEKANIKLHQLSETAKAWRCIEQTLGIDHRSPSQKEEQYAHRWMQQWQFTPEMLRCAYERCVDATGKLSLHYINKILERWHKNGITTPQQAQDETKQTPTKKQPAKATYDLTEYENTDLDRYL